MKRMMNLMLAAVVLFSVACDKDDDAGAIQQLDPAVKEQVMNQYPNSRVVDVDYYQNYTEVDIMDGTTPREVYFDLQGNWIRTETDVHINDLPAAVRDAIAASEYAALRIDDVDWVNTPEGDYYLVELDANPDVYLSITADGRIL